MLNLRRPVRRDGFLGMVVAGLKVAELSEFVAGLESETGQIAFILYDRDRVLAHPALVQDFEGLGPDRPLPKVTEVGDPILFGIWSEGWQQRRSRSGSATTLNSAGTSMSFSTRRSRTTPTCPGWSAAIFARTTSAAR